MISQEELQNFIDIYEKVYNVRLVEEDALTKALNLLQLYKDVYRVKVFAQQNRYEKT